MKSPIITVLAAAWLLVACTSGTKMKSGQPDSESADKVAALEQRIDDIDTRLQKIEKLLEQAFEGNREPDSSTVYSVPVAGFPYVGAEHAKITIVQAYEFACGYCYRARATLARLLEEYQGQIKVVYKPFIVHADIAVAPAMAVCAAHKQGKYAVMADLIWEKAFAQRELGQERIDSLAREAGLDMARYETDSRSAECLDSLRASVQNLSEIGVNGTPSFYINGRSLVGAQPIEAFRALIDEELAKADQALASGARVEDYYGGLVESGKKSL